jgi:hypothetical protein
MKGRIKKEYAEKLSSMVPYLQLLRKSWVNFTDFPAYGSLLCLYCGNVPIEPVECKKCSVLICSKCIEIQRFTSLIDRKSTPSSQEIEKMDCPRFHMFMPIKKMNDVLCQNVFGRMEFEHKCFDHCQNKTKVPLKN